MTKPSTSHTLTEYEISESVNKVLDDNLGDDTDFDDDSTQVVTPGTHTISNNDGNKKGTWQYADEQGIGVGGVLMKLYGQVSEHHLQP